MIRVADDRVVGPEQVEHGSTHAADPERRDRFTDLAFRDHRRRSERNPFRMLSVLPPVAALSRAPPLTLRNHTVAYSVLLP